MKPFQTESGADCQRDLLRCAKAKDVDMRSCQFDELPECDQEWVLEGEDPKRSGEELWKKACGTACSGFFRWLETKAYKMHVRVLLSRYRNYAICPDCRGGRYQPATLNYRFAGKTLPELQLMPLGDLVAALQSVGLIESPGEAARRFHNARLRMKSRRRIGANPK